MLTFHLVNQQGLFFLFFSFLDSFILFHIYGKTLKSLGLYFLKRRRSVQDSRERERGGGVLEILHFIEHLVQNSCQLFFPQIIWFHFLDLTLLVIIPTVHLEDISHSCSVKPPSRVQSTALTNDRFPREQREPDPKKLSGCAPVDAFKTSSMQAVSQLGLGFVSAYLFLCPPVAKKSKIEQHFSICFFFFFHSGKTGLCSANSKPSVYRHDVRLLVFLLLASPHVM